LARPQQGLDVELKEFVADTSIFRARPLRELVLVTHDAQLAAECADVLKSVRMSVLSLTDLYLPEPSGDGAKAPDRATSKASVVAWFAKIPALGFAQEFCINPLGEYHMGNRRAATSHAGGRIPCSTS
jgi:hypothetical protein